MNRRNSNDNGPDVFDQNSWKTRTYALGAIGGAVFGLLTAYLYTRQAEETLAEGEKPSVSTGTLLSLVLAMISLIRQISESGKKRK